MDKIVVIEDDPGIWTVLRLALKGAGFAAVVAEVSVRSEPGRGATFSFSLGRR